MKNIIKQELLGKLLMEGRLENTIKKYAKDGEDVEEIKYLSDNDPSGNNKYLEWMVKNWLTPIGNVKLAYTVAPNRESLTSTVKNFHRLIQRLENKDINSYKTYLDLKNAVTEAEKKEKEAKKEKEKVKKAKKQAEVIYKDDDWLVISPKSWESSCYYGAGTKWCVASKQTDTHWKSYNKRSTFFYVIDKNKNQKDPLYKVAYRMLKDNKWEFWDAEDLEFSKQERGEAWFERLPKRMVDKLNQYHMDNYPTRPGGTEWIDDDYRAQALENLLGHSNIIPVENDLWYKLRIYLDENNNQYYAVGDEDDLVESITDYYGMMDESEIFQIMEPSSLGSYITMNDSRGYAENEAEYMLDNFDEREVCMKQDRVLDYDNLRSEIEDLDSDIDDLESEQRQYAETEEEIEELNDQINDLEIQRDEKEGEFDQLIEECKTDYVDGEADKIESEIDMYGPVDYFINEHGHFKDINEMMKADGFYFDKDDWISNGILVNPTGDMARIIFEGDFNTEDDDEGGECYLGKISY